MSTSEAYGIYNEKTNKKEDEKSLVVFIKTKEKCNHPKEIDLIWKKLFILNKKNFDKKIEEIIKNNSRHFIGYDTEGFVKFNKKILPPNLIKQIRKYDKSLNKYFDEISESNMIMLYFISRTFGRVNIRYICYKVNMDRNTRLSITYRIIK